MDTGLEVGTTDGPMGVLVGASPRQGVVRLLHPQPHSEMQRDIVNHPEMDRPQALR